jgi:hypothetical protein
VLHLLLNALELLGEHGVEGIEVLAQRAEPLLLCLDI